LLAKLNKYKQANENLNKLKRKGFTYWQISY